MDSVTGHVKGRRFRKSHPSPQVRKSPTANDSERRTLPCKHWVQKGRCDKGDRCTFKHGMTSAINPPTSSSQSANVTTPELSSRFKLMDGPGDLSPSGPRHDNDFMRIDQIRILPTKAELRSTQPAYLPVNDGLALHFLEGKGRLFDTHFRLLREDMLGQLRNPLSAILSKLKPSTPISASLSTEHMQSDPMMSSIRLYYDVTIEPTKFDKFQGIEFRLRFRQPHRFQSLGKPHRIRQWTEMRSLETSALICLVSNSPEIECFLTITKKDERDLGKDKNWSWVNVTLVDTNELARETLRHLLENIIKKRSRDSLALVEFTGVLLPAYQHILETLQTRSTHLHLPFSNMLCSTFNQLQPNRSRNPSVIMAPPEYARSRRFDRYDLAPLKRDLNLSTPLHLSPQTSPNDRDYLRKLEKNTTLDSGQCKGLVTALTQELALIQG